MALVNRHSESVHCTPEERSEINKDPDSMDAILARLRGYPPDLAKAVVAGKIKHSEAKRRMRLQSQERTQADPAPAIPEALAPEPTSAPEPEPAPETKPAPTCRQCGTILERGKRGRPQTLCRPCRLADRRAQYKERQPPTLADRAYRNLCDRERYARERAAWWAEEAERLGAEKARVQANRAGLADQPF